MVPNISFYLTKRSNGIYYVGWYHNGRRRWRTTKCKIKTEALQFLKSFDHKEQESNQTLCMSQLFKKYTEAKSISVRPSTIYSYRFSVRRFIEICGDRNVRSYTIADVDLFQTQLISKLNIRKTTANILFRSVKTVLNYGVLNSFLEKNPFLSCKQLAIPQTAPIFLSATQLKQLLISLKDLTIRDLFLLAALTGMRLGEIINLTWNSICFTKKTITVTNTISHLTKNGKSRIIPMHIEIEQMLRERKNASMSEYVFTDRNNHPYLIGFVSFKFKKCIRRLGFDENLHFHSLRHGFASLLVQEGVSLYEVQKLLGHSSPIVTQIYSHLVPEQMHSTVNKIDIGKNLLKMK
jgi:site-specific recombinase XerD